MAGDVRMTRKADVNLACEVADGMIAYAVEALGQAAGDDHDRGNMLLAMALGGALGTAWRIAPKTAMLAIEAFIHEAAKDEP